MTRTIPSTRAIPTNGKKAATAAAEVLFASAAVTRLEAKCSLPAKFQRMLDEYPLKKMCEGKTVAVKLHVGGNLGFTTIPPLFIRLLVQKLQAAAPKRIFLTDGSLSIQDATARGYTAEVLGAPLLGAAGIRDNYYYSHSVSYKTLKEVQVCGNIEDADVLINVSHFKGHGACGYGAACKNLAMGCVTQKTRGDLHKLEGGLAYSKKECIRCGKCVESCNRGAASWNKKDNRLEIFFHHCSYCRHCVLACPKHAIKIIGGGFIPFQHGLALATKEVMKRFPAGNALHINFLTQITVYCDCWGFSTPALIPDVGIMASQDICAIDKASLDMTKAGVPLPGSLPPSHKLVEGQHMFQRIHGKDPYVQIAQMEEVGLGTGSYKVREIR